MPTDPAGAPKPLPPMLDRFKAMLKAIESNSRLSNGPAADVQPPPPRAVDVVRIYESLLSELTFNSRLLITDLTLIAGDQRLYAEGIANAICDRICKVPVQQKLPALYLLDRVVKNIGTEYVRYFSARLPEVFAEVYRQVEPSLYPALQHLFGTWSNVFPPSVICQIEAQLQFSAPEVQHQRGTSALKIIGQKPDSTEAKSLDAGVQQFSSTNHVGQSAFSPGDKDFRPSLAARYGRPASSFGRGLARSSSSAAAAAVDSVAGHQTCGIERASPSSSKFDYALSKETAIDEGKGGWLRNLGLDDAQKLGNTCMRYNYNNRVELQRPRALIDAYGTDQGKQIHTGKPVKLDPLDMNGIDNKTASRTWQSTEEEEFDWEDMSPTFGDHNESNGLLPSRSLGNFNSTPGFEIQDGSQLETKFEKRNLSNKVQPSAFHDSSNFIKDAVPTVGSGHGSSNTVTGLYNETLQVPGPGFQGRDMQRHQLESSIQHLNAEGSGWNILTVFSKGQISSSTGDAKLSVTDNIRVNAEGFNRNSISSRLTSASVDTAVCTASVPISRGARPSVNVYNSQPHPSHPNLPQRTQDLNCVNTVVNQMFSKSLSHEKQLDFRDPKVLHQQLQFTNQQAGPLSFTQQRSVVSTSLPTQLITSQVSHATVSLPSNLAMPPLNFGYPAQGPAAATSSAMSTPFPGGRYFWPHLNVPNISLHRPRGPFPSLRPGPPPVTSQLIPNPQNFCFISPQPSFLGKDILGLEFDPDLVKMRHESAIADLYFNLPRQCTTCGCRFKCQEQHSSHMDWHVTRNRVTRNLKQRPSRRWFVGINMWLTGIEASGNVALSGLVPSENVAEKKDDEEMAVPADDDQKVCALCGEAFEDFYSDETEDWMYKGAVYMNEPDGLTVGMERSQLGPIVHAKCRSDSSVVTSVDSGKRKGGYAEEDSQRKRMRS